MFTIEWHLRRLFLRFVNVASGFCSPTLACYWQIPSSFTATAGEFISTPIIFACHGFVGLTIYFTCVTHAYGGYSPGWSVQSLQSSRQQNPP